MADASAGFPGRLGKIVEAVGGQNALSRLTGIKQASIWRYLQGTEPSREALVQLSDSTGYSLEWLATGRGTRRQLPAFLSGDDTTPEIALAEATWTALRVEYLSYKDQRSGDWEHGFVRAMEIVAAHLRARIDVHGFARQRRGELEAAGYPFTKARAPNQ